jgi:hypothetical protein
MLIKYHEEWKFPGNSILATPLEDEYRVQLFLTLGCIYEVTRKEFDNFFISSSIEE